MTRAISHSPSINLDDVQHFVMEDASWDLYEKLLRDIGDRPIRVTYDRGRMEIMAPSPEHERPKTMIGRMIEMLTLEMDIPVVSFGSTTFRRKAKAKGLEPDECYYIRNEAKMRDRDRVDLRKDPPPDLVVEIDVTSRSIAREPIYGALEVPEIWRYDGKRLECLCLRDGKYHARKMSIAFPFLQPSLFQQFLDLKSRDGETAVMRKFVTWIRNNGWS